MKDEKKMENKAKAGPASTKKKEKREAPEENAEQLSLAEQYSWLPDVLEALGTESPGQIRYTPDEELLAVKGVGEATLEEIREVFPFEERKGAPGDQVKIRIRPMRGIGGVGTAGEEAFMSRAEAEKYQAEGYIDILE